MIPNFDKFLSFIKESSKTFFIAGGTCAILILFSDFIGTQSIRDFANPFLKLILIVSILGILYTLGEVLFSYFRSESKIRKRKNNSLQRINKLTEYEKTILSLYVKDGVRSKSLDSNDGNVTELERAGILFQSTGYMDWGSHCQYNLTDWAWDYINAHPNVLK